MINLFRYSIVRARCIYFVKIRRKLRIFERKTYAITENTIFLNLKGLSDYVAVRPRMLIKPQSVIVSVVGKATKSVEQLKKYFENHIDHIYFDHDIIEDKRALKTA